jgi:hypothetical protein
VITREYAEVSRENVGRYVDAPVAGARATIMA